MPRNPAQPPGNALIAVTMIGLFIMLIASTVVNNLIVSEAEAVEESLAKIRVYWAARGHIDYALSRIVNDNLCVGVTDPNPPNDPACPANDDDPGAAGIDDSRAKSLRTTLTELYNNSGGTARNWDYDEYGQTAPDPNYRLILQHTVEEIDGVGDDGNLRIFLTLTGVSDNGAGPGNDGPIFGALEGLTARVRRVEFDICLGIACDDDGPPGAAGLAITNVSGASQVYRMRMVRP